MKDLDQVEEELIIACESTRIYWPGSVATKTPMDHFTGADVYRRINAVLSEGLFEVAARVQLNDESLELVHCRC